jgi:hypothetical protein
MKHAHARRRAAGEAAPPLAAAAHPPEGPALSKEDFVREAAYYYYEARGRVGGHELDDWLRAEAEFERLSTASQDEAAPGGH